MNRDLSFWGGASQGAVGSGSHLAPMPSNSPLRQGEEACRHSVNPFWKAISTTTARWSCRRRSERVIERSVVVTRTVETEAPRLCPGAVRARPRSAAGPARAQRPAATALSAGAAAQAVRSDAGPCARCAADRFRQDDAEDRYLLPGESFQDMFARVATAYADDVDHAQRIYDYMRRLWFMPATPVLSNGGADRGLPISCFLNACRIRSKASSAPGTRTSGWPPTAAASAPIGAACARSARR